MTKSYNDTDLRETDDTGCPNPLHRPWNMLINTLNQRRADGHREWLGSLVICRSPVRTAEFVLRVN